MKSLAPHFAIKPARTSRHCSSGPTECHRRTDTSRRAEVAGAVIIEGNDPILLRPQILTSSAVAESNADTAENRPGSTPRVHLIPVA